VKVIIKKPCLYESLTLAVTLITLAHQMPGFGRVE